MSMLTAAVIALVQAPPTDVDPTTGRGEEWGKAAPVGLLVILLMCVAMFFLLRSMNRNMRKVPASFEPPVESNLVEPDAPEQLGGAGGMSPAESQDADERAPADAGEQEPADRR